MDAHTKFACFSQRVPIFNTLVAFGKKLPLLSFFFYYEIMPKSKLIESKVN